MDVEITLPVIVHEPTVLEFHDILDLEAARATLHQVGSPVNGALDAEICQSS